MTNKEFKDVLISQRLVVYDGTTYQPIGLQTLLVPTSTKTELKNSAGIKSLTTKAVYWVDVDKVRLKE